MSKPKKKNRYDQLLEELKIAEAEYTESLVEYQEELKEANLFDEPSPSHRIVDRCEENIARLHRKIERLTDYACDNVEEDYYGSDGGDY